MDHVELSNGSNSGMVNWKKKDLVPTPVAPSSSGVGLPYAPEDFPLPGDKWRWKVSKRVSANGYFQDRFLYPPARFEKMKVPGRKGGLTSRVLTEQFIRKEVPGVDVDAFFASFLWRIPSRFAKSYQDIDKKNSSFSSSKQSQLNGHSESQLILSVGGCKAGNQMCSPRVQARRGFLPAMDCDICCSENGFCRDCCCILCGRTIDWAYGGYSFIRCEAKVDESFICGHVAHMDCALRAYLAGTVTGNIGLDVEYYCRRCDCKTDLISHLTRLLKTCESVDSRDDIEKILNLGLCIIRGSEKTRAKDLRAHIESIIAKLRGGANLEEIWKRKDDMWTHTAGNPRQFKNEMILLGAPNGTSYQKSFDFIKGLEPSNGKDCEDNRTKPVYITSDHSNASLKLEDDIDKALEELKESQASEYRLAEEKLYAQKDLLLSLYQQLDTERAELAAPTMLPSEGEADSLLANVLCRVDQIKHEEAKLTNMMQVSQGFGQTPRDILKEHFGLQVNNDWI